MLNSLVKKNKKNNSFLLNKDKMFYPSQFHLSYQSYKSLFFEDYSNIGKKGNTSYGLSVLDLVCIKIEGH